MNPQNKPCNYKVAYSLVPDGQQQRRGIVELLDNLELLMDYDYENVRLAIQQSRTHALIVYKTNAVVKMRSVASSRRQDKENLAIFSEIYGQGPDRQQRPAEPAVQDVDRNP